MTLAPYAVKNEDSKGRLYPDYPNIIRSDFQRDRDRLIHSAAFRRLEGKTQVFAYHEGRNYRTRLTHSIEVAQITRTLCKNLNLNEELGEAIALAHDLGHAPFGHAGERGLNHCMKKFGGFDHNVNSLKLMTETETHYPSFRGLNLTWETLEGTVKHNGPIKKVSNKFLKEFDKKFPLDLKNYPSLEAQTASFADDIAYNNHDIDDGFRAGFFTIEDLCELDFVRKIIYDFDKQNPSADNGLRIYAVTRALIGAMVFDLLKTTKENISQNHIETTEDIRKAKKFTAGFSEEMQSKIADLRTFLTKHFYTHSNIARMDAKSQKIVEDLFSAFMEDCRLLPMDLRQEIDFCSTIADKADKICTYIANMTDAFAVEEHQKMFNISYRF
ncbi:MAG: deoxyguanosinetriphosphate triphosphohydrolase [bacterium]|nr:deoxyguanosinetriphosphate triphosphohydrolase [bacterium]MDY2830242.1 deoxyguanosinetriphosphate triphosphohydrolase [Alphaproteobacteria bacterium]